MGGKTLLRKHLATEGRGRPSDESGRNRLDFQLIQDLLETIENRREQLKLAVNELKIVNENDAIMTGLRVCALTKALRVTLLSLNRMSSTAIGSGLLEGCVKDFETALLVAARIVVCSELRDYDTEMQRRIIRWIRDSIDAEIKTVLRFLATGVFEHHKLKRILEGTEKAAPKEVVAA